MFDVASLMATQILGIEGIEMSYSADSAAYFLRSLKS